MQKSRIGINLCTEGLTEKRLETILKFHFPVVISSNQKSCDYDFTAFDRGVKKKDNDDEHSRSGYTDTTINVNNRRAGSVHGYDEFSPLNFKTVRHIPGLKNVIIYDHYFFNI